MEDREGESCEYADTRTARQLLLWQSMAASIVILIWIPISIESTAAAVVGGFAIIVPIAGYLWIVERTDDPHRIVLYSYLRTIAMVLCLFFGALLAKSEIFAYVSSALVAFFAPIVAALYQASMQLLPSKRHDHATSLKR